ncbi:hypothetical protein LMG7974_00027 [Campylobacter majalis]|uniref:Conjugal transfer protein TraM n=1 Tax=Campylobacter majalis TaxID=2790656 RepID=A0ABM8Q1N7_9BACT|nr:hypothetical protein [Campylobacter majalis]CAD7286674.1 hypothetical protein LMG7974_00027 [Campylobacter majalis]
MSTEITKQDKKNTDLETLDLRSAIENNDIVGIWENSEDYEKLAQTTVKTMQYINDEQIKEFTKQLTQTNEKILNMTFEGVAKHHEKKLEKALGAHKRQLIAYTILSFFIGIFAGFLILKYLA